MRHAKYNILNAKNEPRVTSHESRMNDGSALILTVVLTSLLAIMGVLFVMMARVNQIATSGISESKELDSAIETVIAKISEELALDIPRKGPNDIELSEYYDYPGPKDEWLASLEPSTDPNRWRQISDVYSKFSILSPALEATIVLDYQEPSEVGDSNNTNSYRADADGDGVADSKWIELDDITSSKGKPIYAAIRIIDNGGMLNVNTAYKFDPNDPTVTAADIDGSSQMQVNLMALSWRPPDYNTYDPQSESDLLKARCGDGAEALYEQNVIWRYNDPYCPYTPFDISDELELRNRFLLNHEDIDTRLEDWGGEFRNKWTSSTPFKDTDEWFVSAYDDGSLDPNYAYRHLATTYNMDRIIDANGEKMVNVNRINDINDVNSLYTALLNGLDPCLVDVDKIAAQIAVNLKDYRDSDSEVTSFVPDVNGPTYYGFERPCVYISELAHKFVEVPNPIPGEPNIVYESYAVELYKPYLADNDPNNWRLVIDGNPIGIDWSLGSMRFHVIRFKDPNNTGDPLLDVVFDDPNDPPDPNHSRSPYDALYGSHFDGDSTIYLERLVDDVNYIVVDSKPVPEPNAITGWLVAEDGVARSIQRDITLHKCIRRLWSPNALLGETLAHDNAYFIGDSIYIQAHPANKAFTNIGEIGMLFREDVYSRTWDSADTEADVRLDLTKPEFRQVFNYLTVWPPSEYVFDPNEVRVKGRININTAPWYVIAQLPWMQYQDSNSIPFERAKAICDKRDELLQQGFWNIGELMLVGKMQSLGEDGLDQVGFPDLTTLGSSLGDDAKDDFEERDLIFARISNLVTVRSDVFTAYILVRIGTDGPQKRIIAILDRSDVYLPTDRVKIVAVHPVADPR